MLEMCKQEITENLNTIRISKKSIFDTVVDLIVDECKNLSESRAIWGERLGISQKTSELFEMTKKEKTDELMYLYSGYLTINLILLKVVSLEEMAWNEVTTEYIKEDIKNHHTLICIVE